MSNQSVVDLSVSPSTGIQVIPQFAVGNGVTAQIVLMNPTGLELRGQVQFMDSTSSPVFIKTTDGSYTNTVHYALAPNGSVRFFLNEASVPTASGSVWVIPGDDSPTPVASALLSYKSGAFTTSETNVPATMGTAFTMYAQLSSSRRINTSVVVTNPTPHRGRITLTLTDLDGNFLGTASGVIDGGKQIRTSVDAIVPALRDREIQGVLRITTDLPSVSVAGFRERYNERAPAADLLISTMPPTSEDASTSQERIFPQLLNGDGFTTEIILYSGSDGATSQGQMIFIRPDGTPSTLDIH
jgi:hypothetical protein